MRKGYFKFVKLLALAMMCTMLLSACGISKGSATKSSSQSADVSKIVAAAKERTQSRTQEQTKWTGPTTGPKAATGKSIVCINADSKNAVEAMWGQATAEAAKRIGWKVTVLDGAGTTNGQIQAMNQAISMKASGIVISADVQALQASLVQADAAGIPVVGIHASSVSGPDPSNHLLYNCTSNGTDIGKALADYVIADSNGKGRVIILYDSLYSIAREKAEAMKSQLATCPTVKLLDYVNSPLSGVSTNMSQLASSWVTKYGTPLYVISIADYYYDFVTPTLVSGNVKTSDVKLLGSDGTQEAYSRIKSGNYQVGTIPEPSTEFGYMAIDALNRHFNGQPPVSFLPDIYIVTKDNINKEGGDKGFFIPSNNFADEYAKVWGVK